MKVGISIKIDVTKIDKSRLFVGAKGTYLDLTTFVDIDQKDQYENNGFISQEMSKEERASGAPNTPILGNCKVFYTDGGAQTPQQDNGIVGANQQAAGGAFEDIDSDLIPF